MEHRSLHDTQSALAENNFYKTSDGLYKSHMYFMIQGFY